MPQVIPTKIEIELIARKRSRKLKLAGSLYEIDKEVLSRDGGSPPGMWYCLAIDKHGRNIDERVPDGYFETMYVAKVALIHHVFGL